MSVLSLVKDISKFFQVPSDKARIDNLIFQAHYRFTTSFFFVSSILLTAFSLIGQPILCYHNHGQDKDFINQYCWTTNTYTLMNKDGKSYDPGKSESLDGHHRIHAYYQWVPFVLFFHGLCFYFPHWIWKTWESGKVKLMSKDIRGTAMVDSKERQQKREEVVEYILSTLHHHKKYAYAYFFCEILNFVNTLITMYTIDSFLGNVFLEYGLDIMHITTEDQYERANRNDRLIDIFPRMTICDLETHGPAGIRQKSNALCVLPLNNLNEKIYIFAWFWLVFLAIITFFAISYSAAFLIFHDIRRMVIVNRFKFGNKYEVNELVRQIGVGDFVLLHLLGQNLSTMTFHQLLTDLNNRLLYRKNPKKAIPFMETTDKTMQITHAENLYPTYYRNMDPVEPDNQDTKQPLITREQMDIQQQNEKTLTAA